MILELRREPTINNITFGKAYIHGQTDSIYECETLEDAVREHKIKGETAISAGFYKIIINWSNRFKRNLPLLLNVPEFEGVRIHAGNYIKDTEGCILVGTTRSHIGVLNSRIAFDILFAKMQEAIHQGDEIYIRIIDPC